MAERRGARRAAGRRGEAALALAWHAGLRRPRSTWIRRPPAQRLIRIGRRRSALLLSVHDGPTPTSRLDLGSVSLLLWADGRKGPSAGSKGTVPSARYAEILRRSGGAAERQGRPVVLPVSR